VSISKRESDINDKERDVSIRRRYKIHWSRIKKNRRCEVIGNHYIGNSKRLINHHLVYKIKKS
jgi:hypothetical protein